MLLSAAIAPVARAEGESLPSLAGAPLADKDLAEGTTIVVVWASWSPLSRDLGSRISAIARSWGDRARVITVNFQEDPAKARAFVEQQKLKVPVYLDRDAVFAKRYAVTSLPFLLVLENGKTSFAGKLPADADAVIRRSLE
jgi:thiol-disulfide isomerase/thioredoxin